MKINRENLKPIGKIHSGAEKSVYENPNNPEQAIGIFHKREAQSTELVIGRFYLTKILHLLFPKNIPDMHLTSSDPQAIIVDKVGNDDKSVTYEHRDTSELRGVSSKIESAGIKNLDDYWFNFKFNKDGDIAYVDSFLPWRTEVGRSVREYDTERLENAIQNLDDDKRELAMTYLKRLEEAYEKALENSKKGIGI